MRKESLLFQKYWEVEHSSVFNNKKKSNARNIIV
jgi:hypothetical protein